MNGGNCDSYIAVRMIKDPAFVVSRASEYADGIQSNHPIGVYYIIFVVESGADCCSRLLGCNTM